MAVFNGTEAPDAFSGLNENDTMNGRGGLDVLLGNGGDDTLYGGSGIDYLDGGSGDDRLYGGADGDEFYGGAGNDVINGGSSGDDFDIISFYGATTGVTVNFKAGIANDGEGGVDTLKDIEIAFGTAFGDTFIGGAGRNRDFESFRGLAGVDSYDGGSGFDFVDFGKDFTSENEFGWAGSGRITADLAKGTATDGWGNVETLRSIEGVRGSVRHDDLRGNIKDNKFEPLSGADYIDGRGGVDEVSYESDHFFKSLNLKFYVA